MGPSTIKFKTIQLINGIKHLTEGQLEDFQYYMCHTLGIEKNVENFEIIEDACKIYFELQNNQSIG